MIACGESLPGIHIEFALCNSSAELDAMIFIEQALAGNSSFFKLLPTRDDSFILCI